MEARDAVTTHPLLLPMQVVVGLQVRWDSPYFSSRVASHAKHGCGRLFNAANTSVRPIDFFATSASSSSKMQPQLAGGPNPQVVYFVASMYQMARAELGKQLPILFHGKPAMRQSFGNLAHFDQVCGPHLCRSGSCAQRAVGLLADRTPLCMRSGPGRGLGFVLRFSRVVACQL